MLRRLELALYFVLMACVCAWFGVKANALWYIAFG
jgi:hypothetical protein